MNTYTVSLSAGKTRTVEATAYAVDDGGTLHFLISEEVVLTVADGAWIYVEKSKPTNHLQSV